MLKAGLAHLWFVTIHPFEDGNGRIARAIADHGAWRVRSGAPQRFYSMSAQIRRERNAYYDMLEATQKGDLDITRLAGMVPCDASIARSTAPKRSSLRFSPKARFWESHTATPFNDRQRDDHQPAARWVRGQAHFVQMGEARQMLAGHGVARHRRSP